jgi:hypothetical protein
MKILPISIVALTVSAILSSTTAFAKEITWKTEGNTLRISRDNNFTEWNYQGNFSDDGKVAAVHLSSLRNEGGWMGTGNHCFTADGSEGIEYRNLNETGHINWIFSDGSTIQGKKVEEISCTVGLSRIGATRSDNYGTYQTKYEIIGGTGRFEDARGTTMGSGEWQRNWYDRHSQSVSFKGSHTVRLD